MNEIWKKIDNVVFTIVRYICVLLLAVLVVVVFYIFFGRYVLNRTPMWGEPLSLLCLVWMTILGSSLVVRDNSHLRVTMFDNKLGPKALLATDILSTVCIGIFALFMIYYGAQLTASVVGNNLAGLNISYSFMYAAMPISGVLYIMGLIEMWRRRITKEGEEDA